MPVNEIRISGDTALKRLIVYVWSWTILGLVDVLVVRLLIPVVSWSKILLRVAVPLLGMKVEGGRSNNVLLWYGTVLPIPILVAISTTKRTLTGILTVIFSVVCNAFDIAIQLLWLSI